MVQSVYMQYYPTGSDSNNSIMHNYLSKDLVSPYSHSFDRMFLPQGNYLWHKGYEGCTGHPKVFIGLMSQFLLC